MTASCSNLTLIPWVTGALLTPSDLILVLVQRVFATLQEDKCSDWRISALPCCHYTPSCIMGLGLFSGSKVYILNQVGFLLSKGIKLLGLIQPYPSDVPLLNVYMCYTLGQSGPSCNMPRQFGTPSRLPMPTSLGASSRRLLRSVSIVLALLLRIVTLSPERN
jgi:hypothetical protein